MEPIQILLLIILVVFALVCTILVCISTHEQKQHKLNKEKEKQLILIKKRLAHEATEHKQKEQEDKARREGEETERKQKEQEDKARRERDEAERIRKEQEDKAKGQQKEDLHFQSMPPSKMSITHFGITITITNIIRNKELDFYNNGNKVFSTIVSCIIINNSEKEFHYSCSNFQLIATSLFSYEANKIYSRYEKSPLNYDIPPRSKIKVECFFPQLEEFVFVKEIIYRGDYSQKPFNFRFYLSDYIPTQNYDLYKACALRINNLYKIAETFNNNFQELQDELLFAKQEIIGLIEYLPDGIKEEYSLRLSAVWAEIEAWLQTRATISTSYSQKQFKQERIVEAGKRADLGDIEFRSSWEANIARILNRNNIFWEYEKKHYQIGELTYLPDFFLNNDTILEVKGFWDKESVIRCDMFMRSYPNINYLIIDADMYRDLQSIYSKYHPIINWENIGTSVNHEEKMVVVGLSYLKDKSVLNELKVGTILTLECEPNNEYDPFAIVVKTLDGKSIGHIEKKFASIYSQKLSLGMKFTAEIESIAIKIIHVKVKRINKDVFCVHNILKPHKHSNTLLKH